MSTRLEPLNYQGKCWPQSLNYLCSSRRHLSFNKKKKRKKLSQKSLCVEQTQDYLLQIHVTRNGRRWRETNSESHQIERKEYRGNYWNNNCHPVVLRLPHCLDLIHICPQIFVSINICLIILIEIPKPYGSYAPFMPSEPGASMRHIVKPKIREIEY